jgi:hypothetical protein
MEGILKRNSARSLTRLGFAFEDFCAKLFQELGYDVEREPSDAEGRDVDLIAFGPSDTFYIQVKYSSRSSDSLSRLRDWAARAAASMFPPGQHTGVLLVSSMLDPARKAWAAEEFGIRIWDRSELTQLSRQAGLEKELVALLGEESAPSRFKSPSGRRIASDNVVEVEVSELSAASQTQQKGESLIQRLRDIPPGRATATLYERLCQDIIAYLFGDHLLDARPQQRLEDNLNILDIVYRVDPSHPFWVTLTRDFRARVIVFECKNYSEPVTPLQVYTTERYMSTNALRPICFLMSRHSPHDHAELAAFGAMRESGKLLIFLSDHDISRMLMVRDAQLAEQRDTQAWIENDPTIILDQKIYDFIARCPR